ncbi:twin-arginine translocation signal domain-containing protein [Haloarchaeobius sp. DFWS5]|uniref:twin-arginine translocation signal domain-containing protein n=1 Tax=Haloarchaeobius sp. DFWS5 TaxID=3446114 RepID=UPI003EBDA5FB
MSPPTRRSFLAAAGLGALGVGFSSRPTVSLRVHVHPDDSFGWSPLTRRITRAVHRGVEQVAFRADRRLDATVTAEVVQGQPVPPETVPTASSPALVDTLESWLRDRDAYDDGATHLYLANEPFNRALGYGWAGGHVARDRAVAFANLGATQFWDDEHVSANLAVHEWLHTVLTGDEAEAVNGSRCEHDLGTVAMRELGTVVVTPLATAYADTTVLGGETRWHGGGCYHHGQFARHDGREFTPRHWEHTWVLSEATLQATTRFIEERLL